jgi:hypothetical protein
MAEDFAYPFLSKYEPYGQSYEEESLEVLLDAPPGKCFAPAPLVAEVS